MKRLLLGILILGLLMVGTGCAAQRAPEMAATGAAPAAEPAAPQEEAAGYDGQVASTSPGVGNVTERMIIQTIDLSMIVTDTTPALQAVERLVGDAGGYIAESNVWRQGEQLRARITVRVPADRLGSTLEAIRGLAVRVESESSSGQDVTEEFTDLDAQLVNLEATETELRELLSQVRERSQNAEDILQVHRELTAIRGEIERVKGRMQYLDQLTAMATLRIELIPDILAQPVVQPGWRPQETLKNAGRTLVSSMQGVAQALIWLVVYILPLLLVIAIPIVLFVLFVRWLVRRTRRGKPTGPKPEPAA